MITEHLCYLDNRMFGYRGVRLSKWQKICFDNRTFGYRGTDVHTSLCVCSTSDHQTYLLVYLRSEISLDALIMTHGEIGPQRQNSRFHTV